MPRPGPRPYECVRRAWHSDRHQPLRGSIIQQIFRVVNGSHSAATKKNREWQEKLPIVVLKAEEIMYSKANSEAEYLDLETVWDRVNEAIDIIIRRDERTETGELLPPCVEAALNLGCIPVRASRSQRNSNPRSYLSPRNQDSGTATPNILDNRSNERNPTSVSLHHSNQSTEERCEALNSAHSLSESNRQIMQNNRSNPAAPCNFSSAYEKFPSPGHNQFISLESNASVNVGCVYPLYSGTHFEPEVPRWGFQSHKNSDAIIVGTPVFHSAGKPDERGCFRILFSSEGDDNALNRIAPSESMNDHEKAPELTECDLSLRLGLFSEPCLIRGKGSALDTNSVGHTSSQEGGKLNSLVPLPNKEFSFFPVETANDPFLVSSGSRNSGGEVHNVEADVRKHKLPSSDNLEDGQFSWKQEPTSNRYSGQRRWPGL